MASFKNGAVEIAYLDEGEGEPIVLVHGFASNKEVNWVQPGWVTTLTRAGRRVIALDNRGHGAVEQAVRSRRLSQRHHGGGCARAARSSRHRARRRDGLFDGCAHRGVPRAQSSGARALASILGGLGIRLVDGVGLPETIADALEAPSLADVHAIRPAACFAPSPSRPNPISRRSPPASAARGRRLSREQVAGIRVPVLVAVGTKDNVAGSAQALAALIPGAQALDIPDRDHMLAVGDKVFKAGVLDFLNQRALSHAPRAFRGPSWPLENL